MTEATSTQSPVAAQQRTEGAAVPRVAVVGAGPGGLAAALLIQARGVQVDLYEAADRPGGRGRGQQAGGFTLESGPVFFHGPWVLEKLLARAGVDASRYVRLGRIPNPGFRYSFEDGRHIDVSPDLDSVAEQAERFEAGAGPQLRRFVREGQDKLSPGMEIFMTRPVRGLLHHLFGLHMKHLWRTRPWTVLDRELRGRFGSPELRLVLSLPCAYMGAPASRVSSAMSVVPAMEIGEGFFFPDGGFPGMYAGLLRCLLDLGGRVFMGRPVERILVRGGIARGVQVAGECLDYDAVVVGADLPWACRHLLDPEDRPHLSDRRLGRMRRSCSVYVLSLGLDRVPDLDAAWQIALVPPEIAEGFHDRPELALDPAHPMMMVATPSAASPGLAPAGGASVQLSVLVPNLDHPVDWDQERLRLRAVALQGLDRLAPGSSARVVSELEIAPPEWEGRFRVDKGAVFSFSHDNQQVGAFRPANRSRRLGRLYWVGAGTHPGSGLFPIMMSAVIADDLLAADGVGPAPRPWPLGRP